MDDVSPSNEVVYLPEPQPGQRLQIVEMTHAELPRIEHRDQQGVAGMTLAWLLDKVGGYEGYVEHPFSGEKVPVSLEQWRGRDPATTWLYLALVDPA
jgi:hypothetical protein